MSTPSPYSYRSPPAEQTTRTVCLCLLSPAGVLFHKSSTTLSRVRVAFIRRPHLRRAPMPPSPYPFPPVPPCLALACGLHPSLNSTRHFASPPHEVLCIMPLPCNNRHTSFTQWEGRHALVQPCAGSRPAGVPCSLQAVGPCWTVQAELMRQAHWHRSARARVGGGGSAARAADAKPPPPLRAPHHSPRSC